MYLAGPHAAAPPVRMASGELDGAEECLNVCEERLESGEHDSRNGGGDQRILQGGHALAVGNGLLDHRNGECGHRWFPLLCRPSRNHTPCAPRAWSRNRSIPWRPLRRKPISCITLVKIFFAVP